MKLERKGFGDFEAKLDKNKDKFFKKNHKGKLEGTLGNFDEPEDGLDALMQVSAMHKFRLFFPLLDPNFEAN